MGIPTNYPGLTPEMVNLIKSRAYKLSSSYGFSPEDREDLEQDMALHLLDALPKYDPKKSKISTFVNRVIDHWTWVLTRDRSNARRDYHAVGCSLDECRLGENGEVTTVADMLSEEDVLMLSGHRSLDSFGEIDLKVDVERVITRLSPELREICQGLMSQSPYDLSQSTGVPRSTIYMRMAKIRLVFERAGFDKY